MPADQQPHPEAALIVAPLPVTVARVEVLLKVTVSGLEVTTFTSVPSVKVKVSPWRIV